ncbi:ABC transporter permease [Streptomyces sp. SP18CS02]|uniref:ABC transporter permease n=1 Tax=Streptomyces sp. SP18CS02 TaxID=3002531 RepID=UPI002E77D4CB|nr:ABC transporter permease [Streptomyces sp. SP18CS02]MEE1754166.1 ABC transporter permease [Streptomyces sp. SP18CS02]
MTTATERLGALGRAELTLLVRNRTTMFVALLMPVMMVGAMKASLDQVDLGGSGMNVVEAAMSGGIVMVLILVVYLNLVAVYVARREELVLKRLRTGEASDPEILSGAALPSAVIALAQCAVLVVAGTAFLDMGGPERPGLLVAGVLLGTVLLTLLAAATAALTRSVESAQVTTMPLFMVSAIGSGLFVPLDVLPERIATVLELLPVSGVMTLVRAGWLGGGDTGELVGAALTVLAWTVISVFAVRRWFRWEPRR